MGEWKQKQLSDLVLFQRGHDLPRTVMVEGEIPVAGSNGIIGFHNKATTKGPGITIGRSGNIGTPHFYETDYWAHNTVLFAKELKGEPKFVFYFLRNLDLSQFNAGSAVPTLNRNHIHEIEIQVPDFPEQKAIAEVLSSLDDKIDLLHRQNKTLESLAQTIFRQWFIEEAEEKLANGTTCKLGELVDTISDTFKFTHEPVVFLNTSDIYGGAVLTHELSNPSILPGQAKKRIKKGDILYSEIRPANKRYAFIDFDSENYVVSTKLMVLRAKPNVSPAILYFYLTHPDTMDWLQMIAESRSGTFPQITFDQVQEMEINFPDEKRLDEITSWAESAMGKISQNREQIATLTKLRDDLLPKLMSGFLVTGRT